MARVRESSEVWVAQIVTISEVTKNKHKPTDFMFPKAIGNVEMYNPLDFLVLVCVSHSLLANKLIDKYTGSFQIVSAAD